MTDELPALPEQDGWIGANDLDADAGVPGYTADQMLAFRAEGVAAERAKWQADAERYRWLRDEDGALSIFTAAYWNTTKAAELDAAIDAARTA